MPKHDWIRKTLVLGSGAVKIGEAAEFDYSGSQCLKALSEEKVETVLVNPNIATIQTDPKPGVKTYLLPVTPEYVERVIKKERPDSIMLSFGGQTALNCGVELANRGILEKYHVQVLGTPVQTITDTEDRELFKQAMGRSSTPVPKSHSAETVEQCLAAANKIGYPVIIRVAFALGGKGSAIVWDEEQMRRAAEQALAQSVIHQVLVEEYLNHWKEIEYEVVRDAADNCITVCNMENFDPMGIHTGESIVVAPSQTLSNREYHKLRAASINAIRNLGVVGECNIQWALDPKSEEIRAIEVNARMSRSSALASKATGYPLAYIAAKLALGYTLPELWNKITNVTTACFEPALDYCVVKIPRWDLGKFKNIDPHIGPQMKSVGEVMSIGRTFEEAMQKAVRMLDTGKRGLVCNKDEFTESDDEVRDRLRYPTDERLYYLMEALERGISVDEVYDLTGIDPWFLHKLTKIIEIKEALRSKTLEAAETPDLVRYAKEAGFSDEQIGTCLGLDEFAIRSFRAERHIAPVAKQIDTLAAEWPARTNYLYLTYGGEDDEIEFQLRKKVIVLGAGVFRIGSSVEFDWSAVNTVTALKENGVDETILINCNPETVSTDYDSCDKLYFEELTLERILDIYEKEMPDGVVVSVGGQVANTLAPKLSKQGVRILGSSSRTIDRAEDRSKFSALLDRLQIPQPQWRKATSISACKNFAKQFGYPVLVRPSYVLSGSAMRVADNEEQIEAYLHLAASVSSDHPVVISKFVVDAREVEIDGVCDRKNVLLSPVMEHIENAGIHSGDATISLPSKTLSKVVIDKVNDYSRKIAEGLGICGPFNIQYLVKGDTVYVIECNARASRSMPYVSKSTGVNIIKSAVPIILGQRLLNHDEDITPDLPYFSVKVPQFSFIRLTGADPVSGVEMLSTGEVACLGRNFSDAFAKALVASEVSLPKKGGVLITVGGKELKNRIAPLAVALASLGFTIFATEHTAQTLHDAGLAKVASLNKVSEKTTEPNILDYLLAGKINLVINIPTNDQTETVDQKILADEYAIRRVAVEHNVPVVTTLELASAIVEGLQYLRFQEPELLALADYVKPGTLLTEEKVEQFHSLA
jgi:carbamoyl-phosphate synthase large subunit